MCAVYGGIVHIMCQVLILKLPEEFDEEENVVEQNKR